MALDLGDQAERVAATSDDFASYALPLSGWQQSGIDERKLEGRVRREAWRSASSATTLQHLAPLRAQLEAQGFKTVFECETKACGGFDFRFATEVMNEPEMHVNLADFRFLSALRPTPEGDEAVSLLVSRAGGTVHVQVVRVEPPGAASEETPVAALATKSPEADAAATGTMADMLSAQGRVVLDGLRFETGSARLAGGEFPSLAELAGFLAEDPDARITLVGHTDAQGALEANIALSRARARAVVDRLVANYGVSRDRLEADGVGYLMPLAPNDDDEGRAKNRRVEAVLTSTR